LNDNGKAAKMQKGMQQNLSIDEMQRMIKDMPEYTELLTRYSLHMHIIGQCLDAFNVSGLKVIGDTEQTIATGVDGSLSTPSSAEIFTTATKIMSQGSVSASDKLRLAILVTSSLHMNDGNLNKLKSLLSDSSDLRALENLLYLGVRNDASRGATKSKLTDDEKKYFKNYARAAKYDLQRFTPRLQIVLEQLLANKLNRSEFNIQTVSTLKGGAPASKKLLSNDLLAFKSNNMGKKTTIDNKDKVIVFFLGGMAHSEVRVVKECGSCV
jgi:syntaxin-binding protein 1